MGMVNDMIANLNKFIKHRYWPIVALANTCAFPIDPMSHTSSTRVHCTCTSGAFNPVWIIMRPEKYMSGISNNSAEVILWYLNFRDMFGSVREGT